MTPPADSNIIAALDLGSNTFRLMLARRQGSRALDKRVFQHIPRLSESLVSGGAFAPAALERAWKALDDFAARIKEAGPAAAVLAGATMAARMSPDGPALMAELRERYGWSTIILTGDEEARLTALGVLSGLSPIPPNGLIFDIGGRSTEFVEIKGPEIIGGRSLSLGVVGLTEAHMSDPPSETGLAAAARDCRAALAGAGFSPADFSGRAPALVGTAGTVTTIAALLLNLKQYDPDKVNNARIGRQAVEKLLRELGRLTVAARVSGYGLPPRRADAIVAGLAMVLEIMKFFDAREITVSDNGLLEALWLSAAGLPGFSLSPQAPERTAAQSPPIQSPTIKGAS